MRKNVIIIVLMALLVICCLPVRAQQHFIPEWKWFFSSGLNGKKYKAEVPGCIYTDLLHNNLIPDPFFSCNEKGLQWIEDCTWVYHTVFQADTELLDFPNISLVFEGLDTYAHVFLNDSLIFRADNMFRTWSADCRHYLHEGENTIRIVFLPAAKTAREISALHYCALPGGERVYVRKAQYQFGWDWGPRFAGCGIWRPLYFETWKSLKISDIYVHQKKSERDSALLQTHIEIESEEEILLTLQIQTEQGHVYLKDEIALRPGLNYVEKNFIIPNPRLWWCNGLGEPYLYSFDFVLLKNDVIVAKKSVKTGLRTIELVCLPDSIGSSFYFRLNGKPVFVKGANYIPQDAFPSEVSNQRYISLIQKVQESGMNMLRVWGGGIYEKDLFYDLCDIHGIMVWQDFMFACAMYPGDSSFLNNVKNEAADNIKRLRNHPCIALWCGNNEVDEGWHNWGWQKEFSYSAADSTRIWHDYLSIFEDLLPDALKKYHPEISYHPSSPMYGWGREKSYTHGDSHYWGVWWGMEPFGKYREKTGRFASEYGFQGFPDISCLKKCADSSELFLFSDVLKCHQKHPTGFETIHTYMQREYQTPDNLSDYIYISQLLQAYGIKTAIEACRKNKDRCMGSLYWQLNDCWPVVSWSGLDYYQHPKALQYFVTKAYQTSLPIILLNQNMLEVWLTSDDTVSRTCTLSLKLLDFTGKVYWKTSVPCSLNIEKSIKAWSMPLNNIITDTSIFSELVFHAAIDTTEDIFPENLLYFKKPLSLKLPRANISLDVIHMRQTYLLVIQSDVLAKDVFISIENEESNIEKISDNYFDMLPGRKYYVSVHSVNNIEYIREKIRIQCLNNLK